MEDQDEAIRRELLLKARAALEGEYKTVEAKLHAINEQIAMKQKELNTLKDHVVVEEMRSSSHLSKVKQEAADEEAAVANKMNALAVQLQTMEARRVKLSAETERECAVMADRIKALQEVQADLSSNVSTLSGKLSEMKANLLLIRRSLEGLTL